MRLFIRLSALLLPLAGLLVAVAPGDLDTTYGTAGRVVTDFGTDDRVRAMTLQPDGKLIAAGCSPCSTSTGSGSNFALARYLADGSLDPSFGTAGKVVTDFGVEAGDEIGGLAMQPDGKIVAAGCSGCYNSTLPARNFALARYLPDGTLDPAFGTGGKVSTDFAGKGEAANSVVLQPDGKIVAAGITDIDLGNTNFALARYLPDGTLDPAFGSGGKVVTDFAGFGETAFAVLLQPDGKLVAAGNGNLGGDSDFTMARYLPDGTLDDSFGTGGRVNVDLIDGSALAAALQPDGKIVAAGQSRPTGPLEFSLVRLLPSGALDPGFGSGGVVITDSFSAADDAAHAVLVQADGKIVAAGMADLYVSGDFAIARYLPGGSLDASFGTGGKTTTDFGGNEQPANAVVLQADGKIIAGGWDKHTGIPDFALARYSGGTLNAPPTVQVSGGGLCAANSDTVNLTLGDPDTGPAGLTLTGTSSNPAVVSAVTFAGSGAARTMTASANSVGTAVLTVTVSDGAASGSVTVTVKSSGSGANTLNGTSGADLLLSGAGADTLNGLDGNDLLCGDTGADTLNGGPGADALFGGQGADHLTGGTGADYFNGGQGADIVTDFTPSEGDTGGS